MKRPIKFRGRDIFTGELHYGFYRTDEDGANILEDRHGYLVEPDSVAQLVGYDCNGNEVYEGDELTDNRADIYDEEVTAILKPHIRHTKAGDDTTSMSAFFDRFWGKELVQDWQVKLKEVAK